MVLLKISRTVTVNIKVMRLKRRRMKPLVRRRLMLSLRRCLNLNPWR